MSGVFELDARGLLCPMPVIRTQDKIKELSKGDVLSVTCTDPGAEPDISAWCRVHGHELISVTKEDNARELCITLKVC